MKLPAMMSAATVLAVAAIWPETAFAASGAADKERTIVISEDRAQHFMTSKVYELKHVSAHDLLPYLLGAVKRFDPQSRVQSLDYSVGGKEFLVISTGNLLMPWIDDLVAKLDYPAKRVDANNRAIAGDGISRWVYCPEYRSDDDMRKAVDQTFTGGYGSGASYFDEPTNMFYFKTSKSQGEEYLAFLKKLDRPVPQVEVTMRVYMVSDNDFRELGIDYVSWKNGPGGKLFATGWNFNSFSLSDLGSFAFDDLFTSGVLSALGPA
ncbi:MAG: hypothetical protein PHS41_02150, partial [Victivallaceae bacterium]|nr:hypothetical protein [Victivallaceae bacterium]